MNRRKMLNLPGFRTAVGLTLLIGFVSVNFSSKSFSAEKKDTAESKLCSLAVKNDPTNYRFASWDTSISEFVARAALLNISLKECAGLTGRKYNNAPKEVARQNRYQTIAVNVWRAKLVRVAKLKTKPSLTHSDVMVCTQALKSERSNNIAWEPSRYQDQVTEARSRGFSPESCAQLLGRTTKVASVETELKLAKEEQRNKASENENGESFDSLRKNHKDAIAVIIGNKNYGSMVPSVDFAHNDADAIRKFIIERLGFRDGNIIDLRDATRNQIANVFGDDKNPEGQLFDWVKPKKSDVFVYYSGHGVPGLKDKRPYVLPANGNPNKAEITGYSLDVLYQNLALLPARSIKVFIDACFSGDSAKGKLIKGVSGLVITPTMPKATSWMTVITAAQNNQFASWDEKSKHGMFTKYLLDALDGEADKEEFGNSDGKVTLGEVQKYLDSEMSYQVRRTWGRKQDASFNGDDGTVLASVITAPKLIVKPFSIEEMDANYVAVKTANLRLGPTTSSKIVGSLTRGKKVYVTGRVSGKNWYRLFDGSFVFGSLVEPVDLNYWNGIKNGDDVADFKSYLAMFPDGQFADIARRLIEALKPKTQTASVAIVPKSNTASSVKFKPGDTFNDCDECPEMVVIPPGEFMMGGTPAEHEWLVGNMGGKQKQADNEKPRHRVIIQKKFAVGKFGVTRGQYSKFISVTGRGDGDGCFTNDDGTWKKNPSTNWRSISYGQTDDHPVACVSWDDATDYVEWLTTHTGVQYRLPSEAEFEYVARAGTTTMRFWGNDWENKDSCKYANVGDKTLGVSNSECSDGYQYTAPVGKFQANAFGIYDIVGNLLEWVEDCWNWTYVGAPTDGSSWTSGICGQRIVRGSSWGDHPKTVRSAKRRRGPTGSGYRDYLTGFRVARTLSRQ